MDSWLRSAEDALKFGAWTRGLWALAAWPVGGSLAAVGWCVRRTAHQRILGAGARWAGPAVYINWHRHLPGLILHHGERGRWMMVSNAPYMEPIARACRWLGLRLVRGASGAGGREALALLQGALASGESVVLAVDGPSGPAFRVKPGCVELARSAGVPVIPVAYRVRSGPTLERRWDRMQLVSPFDELVVEYGDPFAPPRDEPVAVSCTRLAATLSSLDSFALQRGVGALR